ncbi:MAG: hypothetical protein Q8K66_06435 [Sediminibacterium sp.]|nr:hypothetical protein [Sediminibacterium sp.]MDP3128224.1 hypothetical protein [Sediminibacterium sp.]
MTRKLFVTASFFALLNTSFCQLVDTCSIWNGYTRVHHNKYDTIKVRVKYVSLIENDYHHPYLKCDTDNLFYQSLEKRFNKLPLSLEFEMIDCDRGYYYPFVYKSKYAYTLFHRKNKQGKYQDWPQGQVVELTLVRYNRYFEDGKELITIITDIKQLNGVLPVMPARIDTALIKYMNRKLF